METSLLICRANQWTVFYMIESYVMKELKDASGMICLQNSVLLLVKHGEQLTFIAGSDY